MIVVDSSVWIDYFNGKNNKQTNTLDNLLDKEILATGDLIMAEVLQGFRTNETAQKAESLLFCLNYFDMLGQEIAIESAKNYRTLRKKGVTINKAVDLWIATFCILSGMNLLHRDKDFTLIAKHLPLQITE